MRAALEISELGKDFKLRELNEDTLKGNALVLYQQKLYLTGNRYHRLAELYSLEWKEFYKTISTSSLRLVKHKLKLVI